MVPNLGKINLLSTSHKGNPVKTFLLMKVLLPMMRVRDA